jgi:hypothetical protein
VSVAMRPTGSQTQVRGEDGYQRVAGGEMPLAAVSAARPMQ